LARDIESSVTEVPGVIKELPPVHVMYVVAPSPPMTTGAGTFIHELIELAGGTNVFGDVPLPWPTVGFEAILARDPDVLIWPQGEYATGDLGVLQATPGWRMVPSVRASRVIFVDGDLFSRPGPGFPTAVRFLAEALHPSAFQLPEGPKP
ncbi:MAG: ABC transporter substrate-binding protein, partial [Gemmatimonadetes bacterium]|nr:ABC transporter substrate-binding protein [Gemmatimonadota bacterium]